MAYTEFDWPLSSACSPSAFRGSMRARVNSDLIVKTPNIKFRIAPSSADVRRGSSAEEAEY